MKKKILLTSLLTLAFALMLVIGISAAGQSYTTFDVTLTDGTTKTAYSPGTDKYEGRVYLTEKIYAEAPYDSETAYEEINWADVKVLDFSNSMIYYYENNGWTEMAYNVGGDKINLMRNGATSDTLKSVEKVITGKVTHLRGLTFSSLANLKEIVISKNMKEIYYNSIDQNPLLTKVTFEEGCQLATIGQQAFLGCTALESMTLPNTITSMGSDVFNGCTALKTINWSTSMTTIPNGAFNGCTNLQFEIPSNITKIGGSAFKNCDSLVSVTIPDSVTDLGGYAFSSCDNLEKIVISNNSQVSNKLIGVAEYCPKLTSFKIPPHVTELGYDNFRGCTSLSEIIWPNNLLTITGGQNFTNTAFTSFTLPNSLTSIAGGNFSNGIEEMRLGSNLTFIGDGNWGYKSLKRVYIPASMTTLGGRMLGWSNPNDSSSNITFIFTGTKAQAEALQAYYENNQSDKNHAPNNSKFYDAILVSADEYDVTQEPSGYHFVYGYNKCEAFYGGEHTISDNAVEKFEGEAYTSRYISVCACTRGCGSDAITEICGPLFVNKGYSREINGTFFDYGFIANKNEIAIYEEATGTKLSYGIVAANKSVSADGILFNENGEAINGAISMSFEGTEFDTYSAKITGIDKEEYKDRGVYCSAYIIDSGSVSYIGNTVTDVACLISYNQIKAPDTEEQ